MPSIASAVSRWDLAIIAGKFAISSRQAGKINPSKAQRLYRLVWARVPLCAPLTAGTLSLLHLPLLFLSGASLGSLLFTIVNVCLRVDLMLQSFGRPWRRCHLY